MRSIFRTIQLLFIFMLLITACKRKTITPEEVEQTGPLRIKFEHVVGTEPLQLNSSKWYINQNTDSFKVSLFRYYISNIQLVKADGSIFSEKESYHLIDQAQQASREITINNIPYGDYKSIRFLIGVDSTRNVSGIQSGALDVANGMFWSWNSGYIMAKLEGERPPLDKTNRELTFHIGGFSGAYNAIRKIDIDFKSVQVSINAASPAIGLRGDVLEWFKTPTTIKFDEFSSAMHPSLNSRKMAENYSDMFTFTGIQ